MCSAQTQWGDGVRFDEALPLDRAAVLAALGAGDAGADEQTLAALERAEAALTEAAEARWVARHFELEQDPLCLKHAQLPLPGADIAAHLAGCGACLLLAVTLGAGVERLLSAAQAQDMAAAVVLDIAASVLAEQYADAAEALLRARWAAEEQYITGRFSPGYGDLPIGMQRPLLRLLDAQRAIGLTVNESGILLPRKSITALLGLAGHPVTGRLAGCHNCALKENCALRKEGKRCGKTDV